MTVQNEFGQQFEIPGPWITVSAIKVANKAIGHHWFDADTMRFFSSRVLRGVIGGRLFVTSERPPEGEREYRVRIADDAGAVSTVAGPFPRQEAARLAAYRLVKEG